MLESAGLVYGMRQGRENLFELDPRALGEARRYLDGVSAAWERALERLRAFVEE